MKWYRVNFLDGYLISQATILRYHLEVFSMIWW